MQNINDLLLTFTRFDPTSALDILLVALVVHGVLYLVRGTQAVQLLRGVMLLVIALFGLSLFFELTAFGWLIQNAVPALLVAIPVIFQPEIRRGLERLGRTGLLFGSRQAPKELLDKVIEHVCRAAQRMSERRHGALIVFERGSVLQELVDTGVPIDSTVTAELLTTIFYPNTALHDGAVIIRGERIATAASVLPLASDLRDRRLGTRHRAGVGVTEASDAIAVIVSEETGIISIAYNGRIIRHLDEARLNRLLHAFFGPAHVGGIRGWFRRRQPPLDPDAPEVLP